MGNESWTELIIGLVISLTIIGAIVLLVAVVPAGLIWLVLAKALGYAITFNTVFWVVFGLIFVAAVYVIATKD